MVVLLVAHSRSKCATALLQLCLVDIGILCEKLLQSLIV